jgi:hypothetical protein
MSTDFRDAVLRELNHIREDFERAGEAFERAVTKLEERDEARDSEVSDLKLQVGLLRGECKRNIKRDAGLVLAPTTLTAIITAVISSVTQAPPSPPPPAPTAVIQRMQRVAPQPKPPVESYEVAP